MPSLHTYLFLASCSIILLSLNLASIVLFAASQGMLHYELHTNQEISSFAKLERGVYLLEWIIGYRVNTLKMEGKKVFLMSWIHNQSLSVVSSFVSIIRNSWIQISLLAPGNRLILGHFRCCLKHFWHDLWYISLTKDTPRSECRQYLQPQNQSGADIFGVCERFVSKGTAPGGLLDFLGASVLVRTERAGQATKTV